MLIELQSDMESIIVDVKDKEFENFCKSNIDAGRPFSIFFPDYEITTED